MTKAVFEFAQKFGNIHGEWIWHDLYGYVWRPYLNDYRYPWGTWQPYINGSWTSSGGELFWVPTEPWGWVPYHLGIWMWDNSKGWVWLPGSMFAPAWAVWEFYSGMYCWRPFYLYDWMYGFDSFWGSLYWNGYYSSYYPVSPNHPFLQPPQHVIYSIRKDQLKKNGSPSLPMPKEMKKALETADEFVHTLRDTAEIRNIGVRSSDYAPFFLKGAACAAFFSNGPHLAYHKTGDTIYRINPDIMADIARLAFLTVHFWDNR